MVGGMKGQHCAVHGLGWDPDTWQQLTGSPESTSDAGLALPPLIAVTFTVLSQP